MRKLVFALTAASALSFAAPASAQMFYTGVSSGPYVGVGWGPSYSYYDYTYGPWGPAYYTLAWATPPVTVYAAPRVASAVVVERPRRVVRERRVVRYRDNAYGAYAYAPPYPAYRAYAYVPAYGAYRSPYLSVGVRPRYGWHYE
jgi:hypothetical protein